MENSENVVMDELTEVYEGEPTTEVTVWTEGPSNKVKALATLGGMALAGGVGFLGYKAIGWWKRRKLQKELDKQIQTELDSQENNEPTEVDE